MKLAYDPADGQAFWDAIRPIPGYPPGEERPIRTMLFQSDALFELPRVLEEIGSPKTLLVVMDPTPMRRGQAQLKSLVLETLEKAGWELELCIMQPDGTGQVHTDMAHVDAVKQTLRPGLSVLALGSGTITDIAKHACFLFEQESGSRLPFVVFQTANSVSAFTSNMAPVFVEGVKRTLPSRYADALICDLETLRDAPREMTVAGVGDLLAAFISFPDWYLAFRLGMDPSYTPLPETLLGPLGEIFLEHADDIRNGSLEGMALLAKLIALGGLAMSLSHATTPLSGLEHVTSHLLDLQAEFEQRPLAAHGTQVALASILAAEAYERFLVKFDPTAVRVDACYPTEAEMRARILVEFGRLDPSGRAGAECWSDYRIKLEAWKAHRADLERFLNEWRTIRPELERRTRAAGQLAAILRAVGGPRTFAELNPTLTQERVRFAFLSAPLMRKRLTLGDLLIWFHWDREALWEQAWTHSQNVTG